MICQRTVKLGRHELGMSRHKLFLLELDSAPGPPTPSTSSPHRSFRAQPPFRAPPRPTGEAKTSRSRARREVLALALAPRGVGRGVTRVTRVAVDGPSGNPINLYHPQTGCPSLVRLDK